MLRARPFGAMRPMRLIANAPKSVPETYRPTDPIGLDIPADGP